MADRVIADISPIDPDVIAITSWLAGELHGGERADLERRLREDDAFWMKAGPIVKLWNLPLDYEAMLARHAAMAQPPATDRASDWARDTAAAIVRGAGAEPATAPRAERPFVTAAKPATVWAEITRLMEQGLRAAAIAAVVAYRIGFRVAAAVGVVLMFGLGVYASYRDADDSALVRRAVHAVTRPPVRGGTRVETQAGQELAFVLPSGASVTLRGPSRLEWNATGLVVLRGEAAVEVPAGLPEQRIVTDNGAVIMAPGRYAIGRGESGKLALVSVMAGLARLRTDTTRTPDAAAPAGDEELLQAGEFGSLSSRGLVWKDPPHLATGHPLFERRPQVLRADTSATGVRPWRRFSWIRVAPGGSVTWDSANPSLLQFAGEVALVLDARDGMTQVQTDFGESVILGPGSYALKTVEGGEAAPALIVSTARGRAWIVPDMAAFKPDGAAIGAGQFGWSQGRAPRVTGGGAEYPSVIPDSLAPREPSGREGRARP